MRFGLIIIIILISISCKDKTSKEAISRNCFPYTSVDSVRLYFTNKNFDNSDSIIVEGKKNINPINDYYFTTVDIKTFDVAYDSVITLDDEKTILTIQSIFKPVRFSYSQTTKCEPIYRDAIFFYKQNKIVGAIKICFDCEKILFNSYEEKNKYFQDSKQFNVLKSYFNKNIHPIIH
jgi:hypothetical protein